jgi:hypothetical protein
VETALFTLLFSELQIQQKLMFYSEKLERHFSASFSPASLHRVFPFSDVTKIFGYLEKYNWQQLESNSGHDY